MVRIALAQIFYKPAIVERDVNHLSEPGLVQDDVCTTSLLEKLSLDALDKRNDLKELQENIHGGYITYISQKLREVCKQICKIYQPDLLVFPEYSVPYSCLPTLRELALQYKITIVAGSHTVRMAAVDYYAQAELELDSNLYAGCSVAPVFFPDGKTDYQIKHDRSIFEITMQESDEPFKRFYSTTRDSERYSFYVIICADALSLDTLGKLDLSCEENGNENLIVLTVACSTKTDGFQAAAELLALKQIPTLVCNTSRYGGSGIYLTPSVRERFSNSPGQSAWLEAAREAVMMLNFHPGLFAIKRGVLDTTVRGSWAVCPILYGEKPSWVHDYKQILQDINKSLNEGDTGDACDYAEMFLSLYDGQLPKQLVSAFNSFIEQIDNFCGDISSHILLLRYILLPFHSTQAHLRNEIQNTLKLCMDIGVEALPLIEGLMKQRERYSEEPIVLLQPILPVTVDKPAPTQDEVLAFRDRGYYMNQLQEAITDQRVRLILVSGAYGIGKSSLVAVNFKKNLPNWCVHTISLTPTTRFSMVLEFMANAINHPLRADKLTSSGKKTIKPLMDRLSKALLAKDGRAIVVDQMESILLGTQGKDHTLLTLFRDAVYNMTSGQGKIVFLSDVRFSTEIFPDNPAVKRIVLGRISDNDYVKKILEYEMRRHNLTSPGKIPEIPGRLYELVNGHPLTAKLCVEAMARQSITILEDISLDQVQAQVIHQLLEKIHLDQTEKQLICLLAVFRTQIDIPRLEPLLLEPHKKLLKENINKLYMSSFVSAGENCLEIAAVFRKYYYDQILEDDRLIFHEYALRYYKELHEELIKNCKFNAIIYAEIAYHLTRLNRIEELKKYLPGNVNTLKQLSKSLYQRDKNYFMALQIYKILYEVDNNDVEVLSYLGRCYARQSNWDFVKTYFEKAISAAEQKKEDTWYLYRDWGHLYVRYYMDAEAEEKLSEARRLLHIETMQDDDAGILAAEGYLAERNHDIDGAVEKYEAALCQNYYHEFTIQNYANLLRKQGNISAATNLEERLLNDNYESLGESTDSFYSGFDILDSYQEMDEE